MKFCPLLPGEVCRIPSMCRDFLGLRPPVSGGRQRDVFIWSLLGQLRSNSTSWTDVSNTFGYYGYPTLLQQSPRDVSVLQLLFHMCYPMGMFLQHPGWHKTLMFQEMSSSSHSQQISGAWMCPLLALRDLLPQGGGRRLEECPADVEIPSFWVFFIHLCIQPCLEQGGGLETCRDPFQPQLLSSVQQKMQVSPKPKMSAFAPEQITDFHSVTLRCFFLLTSEYKY